MKKITLLQIIANWTKFSQWLEAVRANYAEQERNKSMVVQAGSEEPKPQPPIVIPPFPFGIK